jgi:hypothetical protein
VVDGAGSGVAAEVADIGGGEHGGAQPSPWPARGPARADAAWQWRTLLALEREQKKQPGRQVWLGRPGEKMRLSVRWALDSDAPTVGGPSM